VTTDDAADERSALRGRARRAWNHPARHVLQNVAMRLGPLRWVARRFHQTGAMDDPAVVVDRAATVLDAAHDGGVPVSGARLVEIGPGHTLGVAVSLLLAGAARVEAVDTVSYAASVADARSFVELWRACADAGIVNAADGSDPNEALVDAVARLEYQVVDGRERWPFVETSHDIVYSFSVLEHVRDLRRLLEESRRVLRPGGLSIHEIDLRDHYNLGPGENWLAFLEFDDRQWDRMTSARFAWCNRTRSPELQALFEELFELVEFKEERAALPMGFDPGRLASRFRRFDLDDLAVASVFVVARRRR
jgi:SAM-dependent methyltransferase